MNQIPRQAIPMKQWRTEQAMRMGITLGSFNNKLYTRREIPYPIVIRINPRVVYVIQTQSTI